MNSFDLGRIGLPLVLGAFIATGCNNGDKTDGDTDSGNSGSGSGDSDTGFTSGGGGDPEAALWTPIFTIGVDKDGALLPSVTVGTNSVASSVQLLLLDEDQGDICLAELALKASNFCAYATAAIDTDDTDAGMSVCGGDVDAFAIANEVPMVINFVAGDLSGFSAWTDGDGGDCGLAFDEYWADASGDPLQIMVGDFAFMVDYDSEYRSTALDYYGPNGPGAQLVPAGVSAADYVDDYTLAGGFNTSDGIQLVFTVSGLEVDDSGALVVEGMGQNASAVDLENSDFLDADGAPAKGLYQVSSPFVFFAPGYSQ